MKKRTGKSTELSMKSTDHRVITQVFGVCVCVCVFACLSDREVNRGETVSGTSDMAE